MASYLMKPSNTLRHSKRLQETADANFHEPSSNIKPPSDFISSRMARPVEATDSEHMAYFEGALTPDMVMRTLQAFIDKREDHPESLIDIGTCPIHVCEPAECPVAGCPPSLPA